MWGRLQRRFVAEFRLLDSTSRPQNVVDYLKLVVDLWVERSAHPHLDAGEGEQLLPERAGEDGVMVTNDGARDAVELDNVVEECLGHRYHGVRVAQRDEVGVLGEHVHHCHDHRLAPNSREAFHEVDGDVYPH
jgi:hypothetical protein